MRKYKSFRNNLQIYREENAVNMQENRHFEVFQPPVCAVRNVAMPQERCALCLSFWK